MKKKISYKSREPLNKINEDITSDRVRLVGDDTVQGFYSFDEALKKAIELDLDLVEITEQEGTSICKIMEYSKFRYQKKKKLKEIKAKSNKIIIKEIRFSPNTNSHDLDFKSNHAINFLKEGNMVKAWVHFHGRSIVHKDRGEAVLNNFIEKTKAYSKIHQPLKTENKRIIVVISPKK